MGRNIVSIPFRGGILLVGRPPLGLLALTAYFTLWGLALTAVSIALIAYAIGYPRELSAEGLAVAFAGIPVVQTLTVLTFLAAYGLAACRPWALGMGRTALLAVVLATVCIFLLGTHTTLEAVGGSINGLLLLLAWRYLERPDVRRFIKSAESGQ